MVATSYISALLPQLTCNSNNTVVHLNNTLDNPTISPHRPMLTPHRPLYLHKLSSTFISQGWSLPKPSLFQIWLPMELTSLTAHITSSTAPHRAKILHSSHSLTELAHHKAEISYSLQVFLPSQSTDCLFAATFWSCCMVPFWHFWTSESLS